MRVYFSDLNAQHREIKKEINSAITRVVRKGDFILGGDVLLLENEFARFCGSRYAAGVSSGTAALFLALLALKIKPGDEVIVPTYTFIATANVVSYVGAKPVFVDINESTYNIDTQAIRKAVTKKTRAIIPVHLYGQPADMPEILKISGEYGLKVVEDAAQAHGARIRMPNGRWQRVGGLGDAGAFSFYPSKNLGGFGDGGMVVTDNEPVYRKLMALRNCGRVSKYDHDLIGYNARLDTIQAAVLRAKLKELGRWTRMRVRVARIYDALLKDVAGVAVPYVSPRVEHVYNVYALRTVRRDEVFRKLKEKGVDVLIHYPIPLHLQQAYRGLGYARGDFPVAERVAQEIISLPMYPHLKETQVRFIVTTIKKILKNRA